MTMTRTEWLDRITVAAVKLVDSAPPPEETQRAAEDITALLRSGSVRAIPKLAEALQTRLRPHQQGLPPTATRASWLERIFGPKLASRELEAKTLAVATIMLTAHRDGRIRERAVRALTIDDLRDHPFALSLLMLRLNDWVPHVRACAEARLRDALPKLAPADLASVLPLLLNRALWFRPSTIGRALITRILADPAVIDAATKLLRGDRQNNAAQLIREMITHASFDGALEDLALNARHPSVREVAFRALLGAVDGVMTIDFGRLRFQRATALKPDHAALLRAGMSSTSAGVRYLCVQTLGPKYHDNVAEYGLAAQLLDPSAKVSKAAAFWINNGEGHPRYGLLEHVKAGRNVKQHHCALLAHYGAKRDIEWLLQLAANNSGVLKISAIAAASQLSPSEAGPQLETIALTGAADEASLAAGTLVRHAVLIQSEKLLAIAATDPHGFMRRRSWRLLQSHSAMVHLDVVLTLAGTLSEAELTPITNMMPQFLSHAPPGDADTQRIKAEAERVPWIWRRVALWF